MTYKTKGKNYEKPKLEILEKKDVPHAVLKDFEKQLKQRRLSSEG